MDRVEEQRAISPMGMMVGRRLLCMLALLGLLAGCGSAGVELREGVASLEVDQSCVSAKTPKGAGWSGNAYCFPRDDRTLSVLASLAVPDYSPQGLALIANPRTDLKFFLEDGHSFSLTTDSQGFVAFEVKSKSLISYFLIRYSPTEQLKCDAEVGGPVCALAT
jgi:hypothetical protein